MTTSHFFFTLKMTPAPARGTQWLVLGNICSEGLKSPKIHGFNCSKREISLTNHHLGLSEQEDLLVPTGTNLSFRVQNKVLAFSAA